ncbi:MAG: hypothetical protein WDM92_12395 [Caulobacteraceae bacterium]
MQLPLSLEIEALLTALLGLWLFAEALGGRRERGAARALLAAGAALLVASRAPHAAAAAMALDAADGGARRPVVALGADLAGVDGVAAGRGPGRARRRLHPTRPAGGGLSDRPVLDPLGAGAGPGRRLSGLQPSAQAARAGLSE